MRGVNATAPMKFDHPGLGTTATRSGDRLVIQNDIGTTDAHVLVVHVDGLQLSLVHTDVHAVRLRFFKDLFDRAGFDWTERGAAVDGGYTTLLGRCVCARVGDLEDLLALVGSRLVFLIDWNRARKRLSRFVKKADAIAALRWAAEHNYGHRAFLEAGGEHLIYDALERVAAPQLRSGARLDDVLGRDAARTFLETVLRITSDALQQNRSLRLVRDELQAELLGHLRDSQQGVLAIVSDHAALIVALSLAVRDALGALRSDAGNARLSLAAERAKRWESKADDIVNHAREAHRHVPDADVVRRLLTTADDAADGLEEAMFLLGLLQDRGPSATAVDALARVASVCVDGAKEYVRCLEIARDVRRNGTREDVQQFLVAVDRITTLEHASDEAERAATAAILTSNDDFRSLHLFSEIAHALEESSDVLARSALTLKDWVMSELRWPD
jgi:uncharacterized protein Yka (UPF0111/DUF47 family)